MLGDIYATIYNCNNDVEENDSEDTLIKNCDVSSDATRTIGECYNVPPENAQHKRREESTRCLHCFRHGSRMVIITQ